MNPHNDTDSLAGNWHCRYWYQNTKHDGREDISEYYVHIQPQDGGYMLTSVAEHGEATGSYMEARFTVDNTVVTGTYLETTAPGGEWAGMTYRGAFQLLLSADGKRMEGMRVSASYNNGNPKVTTGRWELVRADAMADQE